MSRIEIICSAPCDEIWEADSLPATCCKCGAVHGEFAEPSEADRRFAALGITPKHNPALPGPFDFLLQHWSTKPTTTIPRDSQERKSIPVYSGVVRYAPAALVCVAVVSRIGNDKHNPGQPLHHARGKSNDHPDCSLRHMIDGADEQSELEHAACEAWRALIRLQELCEKHGAPMAPGARK
jgi:hypothetical protein